MKKLTELIFNLSSNIPHNWSSANSSKSPSICKCYKLKHALYHAIKSTAKILIKCSTHSFPIQQISGRLIHSKGDNTNLKIVVSLLTGAALLSICIPFLKEILLKECAPKITEKSFHYEKNLLPLEGNLSYKETLSMKKVLKGATLKEMNFAPNREQIHFFKGSSLWDEILSQAKQTLILELPPLKRQREAKSFSN